MRAQVLPEPELEFGGANRHIDPRFGIANYGPADLAVDGQHRTIRLGLIGAAPDLDALTAWIQQCREPIEAKDGRYPHLFPPFPGCSPDHGLHASLTLTTATTRKISSRAIKTIEQASAEQASAGHALGLAVETFAQEAIDLAETNRVDVIVIARPTELHETLSKNPGTNRRRSRPTTTAAPTGVPTFGEAAHLPRSDSNTSPRHANFHDLLKARLIGLGVPVQIIRRSTFDSTVAPPAGHSLQDEATRAWNLHVALYYKAGGVPWRLLRDPHQLATLYVGISFYRHSTQETLETAVAQVFNERGDGVIVRGGGVVSRGFDKQPHMTETDAHDLLAAALNTYRREHKHLPARIVVHKSSDFTAAETAGLDAAADDHGVDDVCLTWVTPSEDLQLFRRGYAPPLRGTHVTLDDSNSALYTKGSVEFYKTYPGMYVPSPIGLRHHLTNESPTSLAREVLALTKMNWNQTQLDGKLPVTLRTAKQVSQILRFCPPDAPIAARYAHYM